MKTLDNMWRLIIEKNEAGQLTVTAHYTVSCECGLSKNGAMPITLTGEQKTRIKNFLAPIVIPQIKSKEGI